MKWILILIVFVVACGDEPDKSFNAKNRNNVNNTNNVNNDDRSNNGPRSNNSNNIKPDNNDERPLVGRVCDECPSEMVCKPELWDGGYCTNACENDADCGDGAHCAMKEEGEGGCFLGCSTHDDCGRENLECWDVDKDGIKECIGINLNARPVGAGCTDASECSGPIATCLTSQPDGYCTHICQNDAECGDDAHCTPGGYCLKSCEENIECRNGYVCAHMDEDDQLECIDESTYPSVGAACDANMQCEDGGCIGSPSDPSVAMCTFNCGGDSYCGPKASCYEESYCMKHCDADNDCLNGQTCVFYVDAYICI